MFSPSLYSIISPLREFSSLLSPFLAFISIFYCTSAFSIPLSLLSFPFSSVPISRLIFLFIWPFKLIAFFLFCLPPSVSYLLYCRVIFSAFRSLLFSRLLYPLRGILLVLLVTSVSMALGFLPFSPLCVLYHSPLPWASLSWRLGCSLRIFRDGSRSLSLEWFSVRPPAPAGN